ncbi:MAG TPA: hypothetical protein VKV32_02445, partial [Stellaceae bacterium]|nr:hypothetical protein [Stellaceae bacterium]
MNAALNAATSVGGLLDRATAQLAAAGIAEPRREARLVIALALGVAPAAVLGWPERIVDLEQAATAAALIARRARHEPFSRLKGSREF